MQVFVGVAGGTEPIAVIQPPACVWRRVASGS
jgi:hypothetical protein